jgi:hypothetical protein
MSWSESASEAPSPVVLVLRPLLAGGVDLAAVVAPSLLGVREDVVGGGHLREALGDVGLVGIEIGMQLLGQAPVGALDLVLAGVALDAEDGVEIVAHGCSRTGPLIATTW